MYRVNSLGAEWSHDHIDYPHHSLLYVEYVDQCVTLTPSSFVSPEQAPLVSGIEKLLLVVSRDKKLIATHISILSVHSFVVFVFPSSIVLGILSSPSYTLLVSV